MDWQRVKRFSCQSSVLGVGFGLGFFTLLYFIRETNGHPLGLLTLVIPLLLSLGVFVLGVGLLREEADSRRVLVVGISSVGGILLMTVVSAWMIAIQHLASTGLPRLQYLVVSNVSIGAALGTVLGVYRVRLHQRTDQLAREVNRLNEFAGIVAHDLRNPLHIAQGYLAELPRTGLEDEMTSIERAHERMERLIDHVLALSRRGTAVGEPEPVEVRSVAEAAWKDVPTGEADIHVDLNSEYVLTADERRLRSLFENLFRNAIDHGGSTATVTVGALEHGFYVADDGVGIPEQHREQIFEGGFSTDETGTGLGLAIVRQIADAHDWTITVTDSTTGGARFEFATQ